MSRSWLAIAGATMLLIAGCMHQPVQVGVGVGFGAEPVCPYGYFDYAPYECAPYGYYGPAWFMNGLFIGAGPWFHGPRHFRGPVDNHFDPHHGYHGPRPERGEHPNPNNHPDRVQNFHGNETRDGLGRTVRNR